MNEWKKNFSQQQAKSQRKSERERKSELEREHHKNWHRNDYIESAKVSGSETRVQLLKMWYI